VIPHPESQDLEILSVEVVAHVVPDQISVVFPPVVPPNDTAELVVPHPPSAYLETFAAVVVAYAVPFYISVLA